VKLNVYYNKRLTILFDSIEELIFEVFLILRRSKGLAFNIFCRRKNTNESSTNKKHNNWICIIRYCSSSFERLHGLYTLYSQVPFPLREIKQINACLRCVRLHSLSFTKCISEQRMHSPVGTQKSFI